MKVISNIKDGLKMSKDKAVSVISGIGAFLKNRENRVMVGVILGGLSAGLIASGYVRLPQ